jgi:hypothetical protein
MRSFQNHAGTRWQVFEVHRAFAHRARAAGTPAIAARMQLEAMHVDQLGGEQEIDQRLVRRWFVEAFYFEREA